MHRVLPILVLALWLQPAQAYYDYEKVEQMLTTGRLVDVAWHPDGEYALVLESGGAVLSVDASDWSVSVLEDLDRVSLVELSFHPDGEHALIAANGLDDEGQLYRYDHAAGTVEHLADCDKAGVSLRAVSFAPDGSWALVIGWTQLSSAGGILYAYAYTYDEVGEVHSLSIDAATNAWGPTDAAWQPDGQQALITIGENDAEVIAYRLQAPSETRLLATGYRGSNAYSVDTHPIDGYGLVVSFNNKAYKYDGVWTDAGIGAYNMAGVAFNTDGSRALLVGRARAPSGSVVGTVIEFVDSGGSFTAADFRDVSIPGFGSGEWQADSNSYLNAAAFRPGLCEGLIVGAHSSNPPRDSPIVHFTDIRGADCLQAAEDGGSDAGDAGADGGLPDAGDGEPPDAGPPDGEDGSGLDADGAADGDGAAADTGSDGGGSTPISCRSDAECPAGSYCDGSHCVSDCTSHADCPAPLLCSPRGRCVPPDQDAGVDDAGEDGGSGDAAGDDGGSATDSPNCTPCRFDSECPAGRYCRDGCCVADCYLDTDCPAGFTCGPTGRCRAVQDPVTGCSCGGSSPAAIPVLLLLLLAGWLRISARSSRP